MNRKVRLRYDAADQAFRLVEPIEGVVPDGTELDAILETPATAPTEERPWMALEGSLSKEAGEELARAVEELFPPWKD